MKINRTIAPPTKILENLNLPIAEKHILNNKINMYVVNAGVEPIAKIDVVFNAGLIMQVKKAQAIFTASMLTEGTKNRSGKKLADDLDFYGAYFQTRSNADDAVATLFTLTKHLNNSLPLFLEALNASFFPQKELKVLQQNSIQKLKINNKKNEFISRKRFYEKIFGSEHNYTVNHTEEDIKALTQQDLTSFFELNYNLGIKYILVSGGIKPKTTYQIIEEIKKWPFSSNPNSPISQIQTQPGKYFFTNAKSVQCSIKIGMPTINRSHSDYTKLQFINLLFGGYFGSRLMKNIREDKGLTYGIYSVLESFHQTGCWYISTEINGDLKEKGLFEIYAEIEKLKTNQFTQDELNAGKNYYLGSILRGIDGAFSIAERNKILIDYNLNDNYYNNLVNMLNTITTIELQELSNKYFNSNFIEVVVGK